MQARGQLLGEAHGFGEKARRDEADERRHHDQQRGEDAHDDHPAVQMEHAAQGMAYAGSDEAHDVGDEQQAEEAPEHIEQRRKGGPDHVCPVDAQKFRNAEHALLSRPAWTPVNRGALRDASLPPLPIVCARRPKVHNPLCSAPARMMPAPHARTGTNGFQKCPRPKCRAAEKALDVHAPACFLLHKPSRLIPLTTRA